MKRRIVADSFTRTLPCRYRTAYDLRASMPMNNDVLAIILGGGQGSRLFPLTLQRSKPAVPVGGSYRLDDLSLRKHLLDTLRLHLCSAQLHAETPHPSI